MATNEKKPVSPVVKQPKPPKQKRCAVLVLGDIGRSPRMQNHALELANSASYNIVYLVGYLENKPHEKLLNNPRIKIVTISTGLVDLLRRLPSVFYLLYALLRVLIQILQLTWIFLFNVRKCDFVLVQNPPAAPALHIVYQICWLKRMKFLVDFHNYGYSILKLSARSAFVVRLARWYEMRYAKKAHKAFCVSKSMQKDLKDSWGIDAVVVYDRPNTEVFKPISIEAKHQLLLRLGLGEGDSTLLTQLKQDTGDQKKAGAVAQYEHKKERPLLLVSSTSWTKDEDFGLVLRALEQYEERATQDEQQKYPQLVLVITGKGPEKAHFEALVAQKQSQWRKIKIITRWLTAEDYPLILAAADAGVCLHYSSSALDLPMKVVDMFGAGVPVFAVEYSTISELVANHHTGRLFKNEKELSEIFQEIFYNWPENQMKLSQYRYNVLMARQRTFTNEWRECALPAIQDLKK